MKSDPSTRDNTKYCEFHRDYGHRTDNCIQLKREIEFLIRCGYLRRFISPESQPQNQAQNQALAQQPPPPPPRQTTTQHQQPLGEIHVILGGFAGGGESSSARKAHLRNIRSAEIEEIQAVSKKPRLDMPSPSGIKEVQRLTGRIAALSRFVSRASDKCQPFFQVLKKAFQWDTKYEEAFTALKTYLSSPPILVSPIEGELLTLYLAVSDFSTSAALVRDKERVQHPVYYCSRALREAEERYPRMEKLILALVTVARKLRPYFQAHTIEVPTEYPMKQVLHRPETS